MDGAPFGVRRFGVGRLEFGVSLWAWQVDPSCAKTRRRVIHRRSDTTNIGRYFRPYTETWWGYFISWT